MNTKAAVCETVAWNLSTAHVHPLWSLNHLLIDCIT